MCPPAVSTTTRPLASAVTMLPKLDMCVRGDSSSAGVGRVNCCSAEKLLNENGIHIWRETDTNNVPELHDRPPICRPTLISFKQSPDDAFHTLTILEASEEQSAFSLQQRAVIPKLDFIRKLHSNSRVDQQQMVASADEENILPALKLKQDTLSSCPESTAAQQPAIVTEAGKDPAAGRCQCLRGQM